jgi:hypothetical protein
MPSVARAACLRGLATRAVLVAACLVSAVAPAAALDAPTGEPLLRVTGDIAVTNDTDAAVFDREMLADMDPVTFETTTIWTDGVQEFTGVSLATLLETLGVDGGTLRATAINDYAIEIPVSDAVDGGPIVAYSRNGAPMTLRDKGPLWIVYPYDANPEYQSEQTYSRSIWQLDRIDVTE